MWLLLAVGSAIFSGATAVIAKFGIKKVDSALAVALRSVIILAFAWMVVLVGGGWKDIDRAHGFALLFPLLSGSANAIAWLCYFKALSNGTVNQVAPIDKAGIALTFLGAHFLWGRPLGIQKIISITLILLGAALMYEKDAKSTPVDTQSSKVRFKRSWLFWAVASAALASAATLLSKTGARRLDADLSYAIRSGVMFVIAWSYVLIKKTHTNIGLQSRKSILYIGLSGLTTALAWLCYFRALADPTAEAGIVQAIDKLSILVSVTAAKFALNERLTCKAYIGLILLVAGIINLLF